MENNRSYLWPAIVIGAAIVVGTIIVAGTMYKVKALANTIGVTGSAQRTVSSDIIKWKSSFSRIVAPDGLGGGYEMVNKDRKAVEKYLRDNKISEGELVMNPVSIVQNYSYYGGGQTFTGYTLTERLEVRSSDVQKIVDLEKKAGKDLSGQGIVFSNDSEEFYYSKLSDLKLDMLSDATKNARERAEKIAVSTGSKVDHLQSASMGVFQVTAVNSTDVSDYGSYDTSAREKQIMAVVRASFNLK